MTADKDKKPSAFDPQKYLQEIGVLEDHDIDLALAALSLATLSHEGISTQRYTHHLEQIVQDIRASHAAFLKAGAQDDAGTQLAALKEILNGRYEYSGDAESYDDLQNASLIRVIDRARGMPITLSILYIHGARAQGWDVAGLNVPGHFVCRLARGGQTIIFDPFNDCKVLEAPDLRALVKKAMGEQAELSAEFYEPATNRDILLRLQNNIKFRQIEMEDYRGALETVLALRQVDPEEYRLLLDEGVLYAKTNQPDAAVKALAAYIEKAPNSRDRMEAELLLEQIMEQLD